MNTNYRKKIVICDDENNKERDWKTSLEAIPKVAATFDVEVLPPDRLLEASKDLESRRREARKGTMDDFPVDNATAIDQADILIVDYDLLNLKSDYYQTGEGVAYLARCYSNCGFIVALNQFERSISFDLSLEPNGFHSSFADLNISSQLLSSSGLWNEPWEGFRPWFWPLLPQSLHKFQARCRSLEANMGQKVLEFLGFPNDVIQIIPNALLDLIGGSEATFDECVRASDLGLNLKDEPLTKQSLVRIAAARVWQWLEWGILPPQNILIDAPHLVSALPSLVIQRAKDVETWNRTASFAPLEGLPLDHDKIAPFRFTQVDWVSRSVWLWPHIKDHPEIEDVTDPWSTEWPDHVFCEDTSRFVAEGQAREFTSALNSQFARRYVELGSQDVDYRNKFRFAL